MNPTRAEGGPDRQVVQAQLRTLLVIAIPIALQTLLNFSVNLLDSVMLGSLGEVQISASALANQAFFVLSMVIYGIVGGSNVLVAQFWGHKDRDAIERVMGYTYRVGVGFAVLMTVLCMALPGQVLSVFSPDPMVIAQGTPYLRIVAVSYVFYAVTTLTSGTLRSVRNVRISLILSIVSLMTNGTLNYVLIFGK
ncbi:MAG: MATE family efflux transporter, partial [Clostridia bacterium]|nr:MATE family efflux transporter [Clostridia bacterium]